MKQSLSKIRHHRAKKSNISSAAKISAAISLAAVLVTSAQVWVAYISKSKEIEISSEQNDRQFRMSALQYVTDNKELIFGNTDTMRAIRGIMRGVFPEDINQAIFKGLEEGAPDANSREFWKKSQLTVTVHYPSKGQAQMAENLKERLNSLGYSIGGPYEEDEGPSKTQLRYFRSNELKDATSLASLLLDTLVLESKPVLVKGYENSVPLKYFELWFSPNSNFENK